MASKANACDLPIAMEARVIKVVDGDTVVLEDGQDVRLIGMQAPKLPLGRPGYPTWPLAEEAKAELEALALGRTVGLAFGGERVDRHGRLLAQLYRDDGLWLQGHMVEKGWARVYSFVDNRACVEELLALEKTARKAGLNIWSHPYYAIRGPLDLADTLDSYQLVEGQVLEVALVRGRAFMNFGRDWKTDFTISLRPETVELFEAEGVDLRAFEGKRVRVRGWVEEYNGPEIEVTHPEQIEILP